MKAAGLRLSDAIRRLWLHHQGDLTLASVALAVVVVAGLPLAAVAAELTRAGGIQLRLLGEPQLWLLLLRTVVSGLAVTLLATVIGVPLGTLVGRSDLRGRRFLWLLHSFPLFVPPFLLALGWFYLLEGTGVAHRVLFNDVGVVAVMALALAPIVTALTAVAVSGIEPQLEEAARLVASPLDTVRGVLLPAARPAITLGGLLVFSLAVSELGVPLFLGTRTYTESVFSRLGGIDYSPGEAAILAAPLLAVGGLLVIGERRLVGTHRFELIGLRRPGSPFPLGAARPLATTGAVVLAAAGLAPIAGLAWRAGRSLATVPSWIGQSLWTSLLFSAAAAAVALGAAVVVGHALGARRWAARALDTLLFLAFLTPAAVLGVGLVDAWNRPATSWLYGSWAILVVAGVARYGILAVRTATVAFAQSSPRIEEAAQVAGVAFLHRLRSVLLPVHRRGLLLAFLITMVFCLRDLDLVVLFYPPGLEPLMVRIFTLEANGPPAVVASLALVQIGVTAAILSVGALTLSGGRKT